MIQTTMKQSANYPKNQAMFHRMSVELLNQPNYRVWST